MWLKETDQFKALKGFFDVAWRPWGNAGNPTLALAQQVQYTCLCHAVDMLAVAFDRNQLSWMQCRCDNCWSLLYVWVGEAFGVRRDQNSICRGYVCVDHVEGRCPDQRGFLLFRGNTMSRNLERGCLVAFTLKVLQEEWCVCVVYPYACCSNWLKSQDSFPLYQPLYFLGWNKVFRISRLRAESIVCADCREIVHSNIRQQIFTTS